MGKLTKEDIILLFLENPYKLAAKFEEGAVQKSDKTRQTICDLGSPMVAFKYARYVDKDSHDSTREVCCKSGAYAYLYASWIDKGFREDTWEATKKFPGYRRWYSIYLRNVRGWSAAGSEPSMSKETDLERKNKQ